jgi:hypothetical protein
MLYNPQWNVMSLESLIAWLESQPANGSYNWPHPDRCLLGCYLTDKTGSCASFRSSYTDMPHYREIAAPEPWTFGAALSRALAAAG